MNFLIQNDEKRLIVSELKKNSFTFGKRRLRTHI